MRVHAEMYTTHGSINIAINRFRWLLHFLLKNSRTILLSFPVRRRALQNYTDLPACIGIIAKLRLMLESAIMIPRYFNTIEGARWMALAPMRDNIHQKIIKLGSV
jgi:hypothetical protein